MKPRVHDLITVVDPMEHGKSVLVRVIQVFDSLDEDWGDFGEDAMSVADEYPDQSALWYAVVENPEQVGETWAAPSFEVLHM